MAVLFLLQQNPIVVEVLRQPPATPELTFGEIILGAIGFTGAVMLLAVLAGLLVGGVIILFKKRLEANAPPTDPGHARLRI
jgi:hypothetical protein